MTILITALISAIGSGIVATLIAVYYQSRLIHKSRKIECLRRVAAHRSMPPTREFIEALNEIFVTFNDSKEVMNALGQFYRTTQLQGGHHNEDLILLIKVMMKDTGIRQRQLSEEFLLTPFRSNPKMQLTVAE